MYHSIEEIAQNLWYQFHVVLLLEEKQQLNNFSMQLKNRKKLKISNYHYTLFLTIKF